MPFWIPLLIAIAFSIVGQLLAPKIAGPKPDDSPKIPEIDETRSIPVLWGEWLIKNPQLFWWGDYQSKAIKKRIFTGLWFKHITTGFTYSLGMALGLSASGSWNNPIEGLHGVEEITEIQINEKVLWQGSAGQNAVISIDNPGFFGGNGEGGNGGVKAQIEVHTGEGTVAGDQVRSTYLQTQLTRTPTWRGLCYLVWRGPSAGVGYYGNSSSITPIAVKAVRRPNVSIFTDPFAPGPTYNQIDGPNGEKDANPVHCLAELFLDDDWGMGDVTDVDFDRDSWLSAAQTCYDEGNGFSYYWDQQTSCEDMADIILRQIDGVVWTDYETGLLKIKLARQDFDVEDLPVLDNSDFLEITNLTRGSWDDTINEVRVNYTNHKDNFKTATIFDQDLANFVIQESEGVNTNINYPGCSNEQLARQLGRRDLRVLTQPLLRFTGQTDRIAHTMTPGSLFVFSWPEEGISAVTMRVTNIKAGTLENGSIAIECVEDKFGAADALFTTNSTGWSDPSGPAVAVTEGATEEMPFFIAQGEEAGHLMSYALRPDSAQQAYTLLADDVDEDDSVDFTPSGLLHADLPFINSSEVRVDDVTDLSGLIISPTADDIAAGNTLIQIGEEILAYSSITIDGPDAIIYASPGPLLLRGCLDTVPTTHAAGARVWFIGVQHGRSESTYANAHTSHSQFLTRTAGSTLDVGDSDTYDTTFKQRALRPYTIRDLIFNDGGGGFYYQGPHAIPDTGDVRLLFFRSNRLTSGTLDSWESTDNEPETAQTHTVKVYGDGNVLLHTETGIVGREWTYDNATEILEGGSLQTVLVFVISAERDGLTSWQALQAVVTRTGGSAPGSLPTYTPDGTYTGPDPDSGGTGGGGTGGSTLTVQDTSGTPSVPSVTNLKARHVTYETAHIARIDNIDFVDYDLILTADYEVLVDDITDSGNILYDDY